VAYELFCIDGPAPLGKFPDRCRVVTADSLGAAITAACKLIADGATVWKLKGSEGFTMERSDIESERLRRLGIARQQIPAMRRDVRGESSAAAR
jgi:hypothetical protein